MFCVCSFSAISTERAVAVKSLAPCYYATTFSDKVTVFWPAQKKKWAALCFIIVLLINDVTLISSNIPPVGVMAVLFETAVQLRQ